MRAFYSRNPRNALERASRRTLCAAEAGRAMRLFVLGNVSIVAPGRHGEAANVTLREEGNHETVKGIGNIGRFL
ncbi:MAG: hypothetical protein ACLPN5_05990 [Roseiarcus sp.]